MAGCTMASPLTAPRDSATGPVTPLVSVITPCHNSGRWLDAAIASVRSQTFADWELLVVDDGSQDDSIAIVRRHSARDARVRVERLEQPRGGAASRNHGLRLAKGRFVAFLDADDLWRPSKLERQLALMTATGAGFSYTAYEKSSAEGRLSGRVFTPPAQVDYASLLRTCVIGCSTVMLDRDVLGPRFFPELRRSHDYALWLSILRDGHLAYAVAEPLTIYRVRPKSLSANKAAKYLGTWDIYRKLEGLGFVASVRSMVSYAWHGFRKYLI